MKYSIVIAVLLYASTASAHCPSQRYYRSGDGQYQCSDGPHDHVSEDEVEKPTWSMFQLYVVPGRTYPPPRHYHHRRHHRRHRHNEYEYNNHDRHPKRTKARRAHHRQTYHKGERKKTKARKQKRKAKARRK